MTFLNEGDWDRGIRLLVGVSLLIGGSFVPGGLAVVLMALGVLAVVTGIGGWCPAYTVCGVSTRQLSARPCSNCDAQTHI